MVTYSDKLFFSRKTFKKEVAPMTEKTETTIAHHFSTLTDPRQKGKIRHKLLDIVTIAICAVISGADDYTEIALYGEEKREWLGTFLELPNGIPSHDTFARTFAMISSDEMEKSFLSWVNGVFEKTNGRVVAIDGKTLRRSHDRSSGKAAIHMVSAWAAENNITLGQVQTDQKSNEITAIPELLKLLDISGCIVTIDAMGCQKKIAAQIVGQGADYVFSLKGNQGNMHDDIELFFEDALNRKFKDMEHGYLETVEGDHGRVETRKYYTVEDIDWLDGKDKWTKLKTIGMVQSERYSDGKTTIENRYFISSLASGTECFANAVRSHWGIENTCHWILDIAFREDDCRKRKGNSAANFSRVRRMAMNLLKSNEAVKAGMKAKRKVAGWSNDFVEKLIAG
jgi:predicted transposase YbfD/YdcC